MGRKVLPTSKRQILWDMTDGRCIYCGISVAYEDYTVDHVVPQARGGDGSRRNLVPSCHTCNNRKGDGSLTDLRWKLYPQPGPRFRDDQIHWLRRVHGVDLRAHENGTADPYRRFWYERVGLHFMGMTEALHESLPGEATLAIYLRNVIKFGEDW